MPKNKEFRVRFIVDHDARFEESNGEARPLTEAEYNDGNHYMGCPDHPRAGSVPDPARPNTGYGLCKLVTCRKPLAMIPYAEYRAYYGNPKMHRYLGIEVEHRDPACHCCGRAGVWDHANSLWHIDFMVDDSSYQAIQLGRWMTPETAMALPEYAGDVAREQLREAGYKIVKARKISTARKAGK